LLLSQAGDLMLTNGIGSLAVVDSKGELIGFLQNGKLRSRKKRRSVPPAVAGG
jgi:CBS domain-containing protein